MQIRVNTLIVIIVVTLIAIIVLKNINKMQICVNTVISLIVIIMLNNMNFMESVVDVIKNYANLMEVGVKSVKCLVVMIV